MRRSGTGSGGGHGSKNVTRPSVRTGSGSKSTSPGAVGQIGQSQGSHVTNKGETGYRGEIFHKPPNFQPVKFGNEVALNKTGSQDQHGQPAQGNPPSQGRDILSSFGPDSK
jgi:hypothetical protein